MRTDILIAGGGLAGGLIALALAQRRPELVVTLVDSGSLLGGNHVWSFFDSDIDPAERALIAPLVCHSWDGHDVVFPKVKRTLAGRYNSIQSERFDEIVRAALPANRILTGQPIAVLDADGATLADQTRIAASGVIDARGFAASTALELGWQKFVGRLLRLSAPHGLTRPIIMDATVEQAPGYRFVYVLPFDADHLFVEDTYYSESPDLDPTRLGERIMDYAAAHGWRVAEVEREEMGVLPIACGGDFDALWPADDRIARVGMAAAMFQPMTGYSLPDAVRTAALVARMPDLSSAALAATLRGHAQAAWRARGFYRLLARLLFQAADPPHRYRLLERFYTFDERLLARFYAGESTLADKARVLIGRPPVPLHRALAALKER